MNRVVCAALLSLLAAAAPSLAHAGTTVITHGFAANATLPPGWALTMAEAILAAGGDPSLCGAIGGETPVGTVFTYSPGFGTWDFTCGSDTPNGEIALVFNWAEESDSANTGGTQGFAEAAADALYAALRDPQLPGSFAGVDLLAPDVHFIGHSRGAVVNSDCVERLAAAGVVIDQVTTLDPHPVDGTLDNPLGALDWGDRAPITWTNVDFADNYWRADGGGFPAYFDFDGMPLAVDLDLDLGEAIEGLGDFDPPLEHIEVHAWYHGTIDLAASDDGDGTPIDNEPFTDWYGFAGIPARDLTGFYYSAIGQGARPGPVSGSDPAWSPHEIYNGDFEIVNDDLQNLGIGYAGWRFHGGDKAGTVVPWSSADPPPGSAYYLTLFAGSGNDSLTHNRLYVDGTVGALELTRRVAIPSANDRLQVVLSDGSADVTLADVALSSATPWEVVSFDVPAHRVGRTQTLRFALDGGGDGVEAIVDLDDLHFVPEPDRALALAAGGAVLLALARGRGTRRGRDRPLDASSAKARPKVTPRHVETCCGQSPSGPSGRGRIGWDIAGSSGKHLGARLGHLLSDGRNLSPAEAFDGDRATRVLSRPGIPLRRSLVRARRPAVRGRCRALLRRARLPRKDLRRGLLARHCTVHLAGLSSGQGLGAGPGMDRRCPARDRSRSVRVRG